MFVQPVRSPRDLDGFLSVVPAHAPLQRRRLDPQSEPFWRHAERELFVLKEGRRVVGRIAGVSNHAYSKLHADGAGFFAWLECPDDLHGARALLEATARWLRDRGHRLMRGPLHIGLGEELGLMTAGFDRPASPLCPVNPPHVPVLLGRLGLRTIAERHGYSWTREEVPPPPASLRTPAQGRSPDHEVAYRPIDALRLEKEVDRFLPTYNADFSRRFGFVAMSRDEAQARVRDIMRFLDLRLIWLAEVGDQPAGVVLAVPEIAPSTPRQAGPLSALRAIRSALARKRVDRVHVLAVAVEPRFGGREIAAQLLLRAWRASLDLGVTQAELSAVDPEDEGFHQLLFRLGVKRNRKWSVVETAI
ncbi:MAG: hypothetical protein HY698_09475 [Deltaproteobacteria bacterium]|nr:hypothetical protein [Deltaproteobacteria bacterium]